MVFMIVWLLAYGDFLLVPAVQEKLCVVVALSGGLGEPVVGLILIVFLQIQLGESVLCGLVPGFSKLGEVIHCLGGILFYILAPEIFFAQSVGGVAVFM